MNHSLAHIPLLNMSQQILKVSYLIVFQLPLQFAIFKQQALLIRNPLNLILIKQIINHLIDLISLKILFQL